MLIAVGMVTLLGVWRWDMRQQLSRAWVDWIAAGGTTTIRDARPAPIPDERNAAIAYRPALAVIEQLSEEDQQRLRLATSAEEVTDLIERLHEAFAIAINVRDMEECSWDPDLYEKDDVRFEWLRPASALTRALIIHARMQAESGMIDEAALSLEAALALSGHLASDPFLILHLVHMNHDVVAMDAIEEIFRERELPVSSRLAEVIEAREYRRGVSRMIMTDALWGLSQFDRHSEWQGDSSMEHPNATAAHRRFHWWFLDLDRVAYLDSVRATAQALGQPPPTRVGHVVDPHELPPYALASWRFMPALGGFDNTILRAEVRRAQFLTALALREHRAAHGEYPATWTALADPMSGKPMTCERDDDGFVIESDFMHRRTHESTTRESIRWRWK